MDADLIYPNLFSFLFLIHVNNYVRDLHFNFIDH